MNEYEINDIREKKQLTKTTFCTYLKNRSKENINTTTL